MKVLLVEPAYRRLTAETKRNRTAASDEQRWYPPLGLLKLARFHRNRGDDVHFVYGCDDSLKSEAETLPLFDQPSWPNATTGPWDRVYVTTLFTFMWRDTIAAINFYKEEVLAGASVKLYVGGVMASLMPEDVFNETGIQPTIGVVHSCEAIDRAGEFTEADREVDIDLLPPDYSILDEDLYAIQDTYYAYTSRGCVRKCGWCGVPKIEPDYVPYIDIKPNIRAMRKQFGDKSVLKLMDNNILASPELEQVVEDLIELGYGRDGYTESDPPRRRVVDFNQGLDARHLTEEKMRVLSRLHISPMRIAFDRLQDKKHYRRALTIARGSGVVNFSNYLLFNFNDTPRDLYERLIINIKLNEEWRRKEAEDFTGGVYSFPMRYAPIDERDAKHANRERDYVDPEPEGRRDLLQDAVWNRRFIRNVSVMAGAAHGAISPTPSLAWRTIGATYEEFIANLYMPEALLRNRNKYEKEVYEHEPDRKPGTGDVEAFRAFLLRRIKNPDDAFIAYHKAVRENTRRAVRALLDECDDKELRKWLKFYLDR